MRTEEELEEIRGLAEKAGREISHEEGELLFNLAKNCTGRGVIVEIGSWKGASTIWLAKGSKRRSNIKVYSIDPHTGDPEHWKKYGKVWTFGEFKKNIKNAKVGDVVVPIVKTSEEAAKNFDEPVELIFIDGSHEYEDVKLDFELWFPKVVEGGVMIFHDTIIYAKGPKKVTKEFVYKSKNFRNVGYVYTTTFAEKVKQNCVKDRLRSRCVLLSKELYELKRKFKHIKKQLTNFIRSIPR